uniref:Uncharacterized protein n=2 Tax=Oryza TaxID=4527 RepID=A0A0D3F922_9ORYZ
MEGRLHCAGSMRPIWAGCQDYQRRKRLLPDLPG